MCNPSNNQTNSPSIRTGAISENPMQLWTDWAESSVANFSQWNHYNWFYLLKKLIKASGSFPKLIQHILFIKAMLINPGKKKQQTSLILEPESTSSSTSMEPTRSSFVSCVSQNYATCSGSNSKSEVTLSSQEGQRLTEFFSSFINRDLNNIALAII